MQNKKQVSTILAVLILVGVFVLLRSVITGGVSNNLKDADFLEDSQTAQAVCTPPTFSNIAAGSITSTSAVVNWTTNQKSTSAVKLGTSTDNMTWRTTIDSPASTNGVYTHTYSLTNLVSNTTYYYRVRSSNGSCQKTSSTYSFTTSSVTLNPDVTAPPVPTGLTATNLTSTSFTLSWNASIDPTVAGATTTDNVRYEVYGPTGACAFSGISGYCGATTSGTSINISGLSPSTTYGGSTGSTAGFTALAFDTANNYSAASPRLGVTTPATVIVDTTAPTVSLTAPTNGATLSGTTTLTATASDNIGVARVEFYRSTTLLNSDTTSPYSYAWNTTTVANGSYSLTAKAFDAAGNNTTSSAVSVTVNNVIPDTTAPSAPTNLTSPSKTSSSVNLSWTSSTDSVGVTGYNVYIGTTAINTSLITGTTYTATGLSASTAYIFTVKARDAAGNWSASSNSLTIITNAPADTAPPVISSVSSGSLTTTGATISWTTNEASTTVVDYGTTTSYGQTVSNSTLVTGHTAIITGLTSATLYHYRVKSADAAGNIASSVDYTFTTNSPVASCPNESTTGFKTAMWVWKDKEQVVSPGSQTQNDLFTFVDSKNVDTIYLYANKSFLQNTTYASNLRTFLNTAWNTHCAKVQLLDGAAEWMFIPGNPYNTMGSSTTTAVTDWVNAVKTFDSSITGINVHPEGIHLDVEPHGNSFWSTYKTQVAQAHLYMIDSVVNQLAGTGLKFIPDVPRWYDTATGLTAITYNGQTKNFMRHIFDRSDELGIMDYVVNPTTAYNDALSEIQYGQSIGRPVIIGLETIDLTSYGGGNGTTSFYGTSCAQLNSAMASIYNSVNNGGYSSTLSSIAIHMYKGSNNTPAGWTALCP